MAIVKTGIVSATFSLSCVHSLQARIQAQGETGGKTQVPGDQKIFFYMGREPNPRGGPGALIWGQVWSPGVFSKLITRYTPLFRLSRFNTLFRGHRAEICCVLALPSVVEKLYQVRSTMHSVVTLHTWASITFNECTQLRK